MSLESRIIELAQEIGADIKALQAAGPGGGGVQNLFVSPTAPTFTGAGVWVQTGINGTGTTFWIEDGL